MSELFILGDPRYLSGGAADSRRIDYSESPPTIGDLPVVTSANIPADVEIHKSLSDRGQAVHCGKRSYHDHPNYNLFLRDGDAPTAGVELETVAKHRTPGWTSQMEFALRSNWFHAERDGSLDPSSGGEYGFEWITDPLPPRVYRDLRTWIGLQNVLAPWVESFNRPECGLHVHVGLAQFENLNCVGIPFDDPSSRRMVGKYLSAAVYCAVLDQAFVDRVVLRRPTTYCAPSAPRSFTDLFRDGMTGYELIDAVVSELMQVNEQWCSQVRHAASVVTSGGELPRNPYDPDDVRTGAMSYISSPSYNMPGFESHGVEVNASHAYTIEFRRGKGTLNGISIHRMVELMTLVVRAAWRITRKPNERVTRDGVMKFISENTVSSALRGIILAGKE